MVTLLSYRLPFWSVRDVKGREIKKRIWISLIIALYQDTALLIKQNVNIQCKVENRSIVNIVLFVAQLLSLFLSCVLTNKKKTQQKAAEGQHLGALFGNR